MKYSLILLIAVVLLCAQSCTIEKRHYRNGYYVSTHLNAEGGQVFLNREKQECRNVRDGEPEIEMVSSVSEVEAVHVNPDLPCVTEGESPAVTPTTGAEFIPATNDAEQLGNESASPEPAPKIEQDKDQAIGAGIAAAIFFVLGMAGLVIKGTSGPAGVFIGAAFLCFILCVVLASFLYPREPKVEKPKEAKEPKQPTANSDKVIIGIGLSLFLLAVLGVLVGAFLFLQLLL